MQPPSEVGRSGLDAADLPTNQFDRRNVTGTRFIEIGGILDQAVPIETEPFRLVFSTSDLDEHYAYDRQSAMRILTFGLDSFSFQRFAAVPEQDREPLILAAPQLVNGSRYFCSMPNDQGQGLAGAVVVNLLGPLPGQITFELGLMNPDPRDTRVYPTNAARVATVPPAAFLPPPYWADQEIRSFYIRLFVKVTFEPYRIPVRGPAGGTVGAGEAGLPGDLGGGAPGGPAESPDLSLEVITNLIQMARSYPDSIPSFVRLLANYTSGLPGGGGMGGGGAQAPLAMMLLQELQALTAERGMQPFFPRQQKKTRF